MLTSLDEGPSRSALVDRIPSDCTEAEDQDTRRCCRCRRALFSDCAPSERTSTLLCRWSQSHSADRGYAIGGYAVVPAGSSRF